VKSTSSEEMREQRVKDQKASETAGMISMEFDSPTDGG